ncbi:MFS transporter [Lentzea guizhouensis]|uniref:MFS transporter n=1 Tax=Lentzea guizhouensis TaxID=1586287 RepID=UPI001F2FBB14|nr:MFS transporter [Lentzea guizhouensis]
MAGGATVRRISVVITRWGARSVILWVMPGYLDLVRDGEFRALFVAHAVSVAGDQFARVALAVHVYDRTASAGLTALTYALTFLPDLVGGPLLSGLADRFARRDVMVAADVVRALLLLVMALPGLPLWVLAAVLVLVQLAGAPHGAARAALLPHVLPDERYPLGMAALSTVTQAAQVLGFVAGGALVGWWGPGPVLVADAVTFVVSALMVSAFVLRRPVPARPHVRAWPSDLVGGARLVWREHRLRALVALACVSGFYIVAEGLAAPYAAQLGRGRRRWVDLRCARGGHGGRDGGGGAGAAGTAARRDAVAGGGVVRGAAAHGVAAGAGVVVGADRVVRVASSYQLLANTTFVREVPDASRGQAFGLAVTALRVSQGVGVGLAGLLAERWAAHQVIAAAGVSGVLAAGGAWWLWRQAVAAPAHTTP